MPLFTPPRHIIFRGVSTGTLIDPGALAPVELERFIFERPVLETEMLITAMDGGTPGLDSVSIDTIYVVRDTWF